MRELTSRRWGVSMERRIDEINRFTVGWTAYYALADTPSAFEELDEWLAATTAGPLEGMEARRTRAAQPARSGIPAATRPQWAYSRKGYWRISGSQILHRALPNAYWTDQGLQGIPRPLPPFPGMLSEPPDADPHVRWCGGRRGEPGAYPIDPALRRGRRRLVLRHALSCLAARGGRLHRPDDAQAERREADVRRRAAHGSS